MIWLSGVLLALSERNKGNIMQKNKNLTGIWVCFCLIVAACSSAEGEASPTPEPETVMTAAAQTADAQLTELAQPQPTNTTSPLTVGTETSSTPTDVTALPTQGIPNVSATPAETIATGGLDQAEFEADVTVPDGTDFDPGAEFTKTWRLRNSGTNTWTPDYALAFFSGEQMSAPEAVPLSANIAPGGTVDISVNMVAPQSGGTYTGFWKMRNPADDYFDFAVYVQIDVTGGTSSSSGTALPTSSGSGRVTNASIQVDDSSPSDCPHTFTFTASFTLSEPATVSYRMDAGSDTPGFTFELPGDFTGSFDAGTHSVVYYLQIQDSVNGWAQLHILAPNEIISNQANFTLSCGS
jgi:hypothetical protein